MKTISPDETLIKGTWVSSGSSVEADDSCKRIEWLTSEVLEHLTTDGDNWEAYYQDPKDRRFWVLFYPQSELHGGGPPSLREISENDIRVKFNIKENT